MRSPATCVNAFGASVSLSQTLGLTDESVDPGSSGNTVDLHQVAVN
jgi:hypothetical protein